MLKIRQSHDRVIFGIGIPHLGKTVFILRRGPVSNKTVLVIHQIQIITCLTATLQSVIPLMDKVTKTTGVNIIWILQGNNHRDALTLNVRWPSYLGLTRSISWLLMSWLLVSPGHQQPWYWLCRMGRSLSFLMKDFNHLCHINMEERQNM